MASDSYEPINEFERRLGLSYINIAQHGRKEHLGRMVREGLALLLFDKPSSKESIVALWAIGKGAVTSETLPFSYTMIWNWDRRAAAVEECFARLTEGFHVTRPPQIGPGCSDADAPSGCPAP